VIRNTIFKMCTKVDYQSVPWVTYTTPELAQVGSTEAELIKNGTKYKKLSMNFSEIDRAQAESTTEGKIIVLVSDQGIVYGVSILGPQAGELIYPWVILIQNKLKISAMASSIAPYPTLNDINKRIAGSFYVEKIFSRRMKSIVGFLVKWL